LGVPYIELVYQPMLELLDHLKANDFRVFRVLRRRPRLHARLRRGDMGGSSRRTSSATAAEYTYAGGRIVRCRNTHSAASMSARASPSTSSPRPAGFPCSPAATPTSTSRCSKLPSFALLVNHDDADREFAYTNGGESLADQGHRARMDDRQHEGRLEHRVRQRSIGMTDLTADRHPGGPRRGGDESRPGGERPAPAEHPRRGRRLGAR